MTHSEPSSWWMFETCTCALTFVPTWLSSILHALGISQGGNRA